MSVPETCPGFKSSRTGFPAVVVLGFGLLFATTGSSRGQSIQPSSERPLIEFPGDFASAKEFVVTADGGHAAMVVNTKNGKSVVLTDGGRSAEHDLIWSLAAAPSHKPRFAFAATDHDDESEGAKTRVYCGSAAGPEIRQLLEGPFFDRSGERLAYVAIMPDHQVRLVLDGKVLDDCERKAFSFAPNGQGWACAEQRRLRWAARFGKYEGGECDDVSQATVSPDGLRLAWVGQIGTDAFVMADGERRPNLARISELHWLPSGDDVLYCGEPKSVEERKDAASSWVVMLGKKEIWTRGFACDLQVSGDGKRLLFWVAESTLDERWSLHCDQEVLGKSWDRGPAAFSPDGRFVAWQRTDGEGVRWLCMGDAKFRLRGNLQSLEWSSDGSTVSFAVCGDRALSWVTVRSEPARPK